MRRLLVPVALVGFFGFWLGLAADASWLRLIAKPVPALALAGLAATISVPVAAGLFFGACGDLLLELGLFVPGLVAFLLGHVAYIVAFRRFARGGVPFAALPAAAFVAAVAALLWPSLAPGGPHSAMLVPVLCYTAAIFVMLYRATVWFVAAGDTAAAAALAGAFLFAFSDAVIALNRFHAPIAGARVVILLTYWCAQALITFSADAWRRQCRLAGDTRAS